MNCPRCRKSIGQNVRRCPYCGETNLNGSGLFQTSTVLISADGNDLVYRSVDEVPSALRSRLLKSTNGTNSATILIADRRGRREIARAMRKPSDPGRRRLSLRGTPVVRPHWFRVYRREIFWAVLLLLVMALAVWVFLHRGPLGL